MTWRTKPKAVDRLAKPGEGQKRVAVLTKCAAGWRLNSVQTRHAVNLALTTCSAATKLLEYRR